MDTAEYTIVPISLGQVHAYLLKREKSGILIDAGIPGSLAKISRTIFSAGLELSDLRLLFITHAHYDHAGALAAIREASEAPVLCAAAEAEHLRAGRTPFPRGLNPFAKLMSSLGRKAVGEKEQFRPVNPDLLADKPFPLDDFGISGRVLPLPGHSAGSAALILDSGEAFVGDAAFNIFPRSVVPPLADDPAELLKSWHLLLESGAKRFYPGHGRPFDRKKLEASLPRLEKLAARSTPS